MKRITAVLLSALSVLFVLTSCNQAIQPVKTGENKKLSIVTTIFPAYDFSRQIVGEADDVTMLLHPGMESHSYEPSPQDILKIGEADLFVYIGGESEAWAEGILSSIDSSELKVIALMNTVDAFPEEIVEGMETDPITNTHRVSAGHPSHDTDATEDTEYDEHIWTSPKNAGLMVEAIAAAVVELDSVNRDIYLQNTADYLLKLQELDAAFSDIVDSGRRGTIIFGDRFPLRYFAEEYGLRYYAAFPGCAHESEPGAKTLAFLIEKVREEEIPVVFHVEMSNGKVAGIISEATGADVRLFHGCHNVTKAEFESGAGYLDLMLGNADRLREALQ